MEEEMNSYDPYYSVVPWWVLLAVNVWMATFYGAITIFV